MAKKKKASAPSWDKIGQMVGKKIERECEKSEGAPWAKLAAAHEDHCGGFFGRALFIIGLLIALNTLGVLSGVNIWVQILIGVGFALMTLN